MVLKMQNFNFCRVCGDEDDGRLYEFLHSLDQPTFLSYMKCLQKIHNKRGEFGVDEEKIIAKDGITEAVDKENKVHKEVPVPDQLVKKIEAQLKHEEETNEEEQISECVKKTDDSKIDTKNENKEQVVFNLLQEKFSGAPIVWNGPQEGITPLTAINIRVNKSLILVEVKDIAKGRTLPKDLVDKFYRDLENPVYSGGVLICLNGSVSSEKHSFEIHCAPTTRKPAVYLHHLLENVDPGTCLQSCLFNLEYCIGSKNDGDKYLDKLKATLETLKKQQEYHKKLVRSVSEGEALVDDAVHDVKLCLGLTQSTHKRKRTSSFDQDFPETPTKNKKNKEYYVKFV